MFKASPRNPIDPKATLKPTGSQASQGKASPKRITSPRLPANSQASLVKGANSLKAGSRAGDDKSNRLGVTNGEKSSTRKQAVQATANNVNSNKPKNDKSPLQNDNQVPSNESMHHSKQKSCSNAFCLSQKQQEDGSKVVVAVRRCQSKKTGEPLSFCDYCFDLYDEGHFCNFCEQIYYDDINVDEKEWVQCDSCNLWNHIDCEEEKMKKQLKEEVTENSRYDCQRCRDAAQSGSGSVSFSNSSQSTTKKLIENGKSSVRKNGDSSIQQETKKGAKAAKFQDKRRKQNEKTLLIEESRQYFEGSRSANTADLNAQQQPGLLGVWQINSKRSAGSLSTSSKDISTPNEKTEEMNRVVLSNGSSNSSSSSNNNPFEYSFENYFRKKCSNTQTPSRTIAVTYQTHISLDDNVKVQGIPLSLCDVDIQSDLVKFRQIADLALSAMQPL